MSGHAPGARPGFRRIDRATRWAGRSLCWAHAAAMAGTAAEALLHPTVAWWPYVWPALWGVTGISLIAWAALRIRQKSHLQRPAQTLDDDPGAPLPDTTVAYDRAA